MSEIDETGTRRVDGAQSIRRAAAILRQIGHGGSQGSDLSTISEALSLSRSTAHRILQCLIEEDLIAYDRRQRRYFTGRLPYELSLGVSEQALELAAWRRAVDTVAQRSGATAYLMGRSGVEAVCLLKTDSNAVVRVIPVELGQRRFLGVGAGSTALLAALPAAEADRVITTIAPHLGTYSHLNEATLRALVETARRDGIVVSRGNVTDNVIGLGLAIPDPGGIPRLALSIAAPDSRIDAATIARWQDILREEVATTLRGRA